ncbi:multicopper oxidase domain-containing protein [Corallococcus interemptor]|uniref:multicopper oxidase domain-containing protein n=1 Tax=Corallococcus interemptor TaxID=2316720 RepID=UPI0035D47D61
MPGRDYRPVVVPNGSKLPWKVVDGAKVFHLVAEEVEHEFAPGLKASCWGYNGRVHGPTLEAVEGDRVRIRLGNLSPQNHHPIHLHGFHFRITETDAGRVPESAQQPETTVLVPVGSARAIEFVADAPGDWALHCHMTHHMMNQMGHGFPNMIGVKPGALDAKVRALLPGYMMMGQTGMARMGEMGMPVPSNSIPMMGRQGKHDYITMGGMFTVLKVRERLDGDKDPGWYDNPPGTLAQAASTDALRRDGIDVEAPAPVEPGSPA